MSRDFPLLSLSLSHAGSRNRQAQRCFTDKIDLSNNKRRELLKTMFQWGDWLTNVSLMRFNNVTKMRLTHQRFKHEIDFKTSQWWDWLNNVRFIEEIRLKNVSKMRFNNVSKMRFTLKRILDEIDSTAFQRWDWFIETMWKSPRIRKYELNSLLALRLQVDWWKQ